MRDLIIFAVEYKPGLQYDTQVEETSFLAILEIDGRLDVCKTLPVQKKNFY